MTSRNHIQRKVQGIRLLGKWRRVASFRNFDVSEEPAITIF